MSARSRVAGVGASDLHQCSPEVPGWVSGWWVCGAPSVVWALHVPVSIVSRSLCRSGGLISLALLLTFGG